MLDRYQLKRRIAELKAYKGRQSSFTTLTVPPNKALADVIGFVRAELAGCENIKSRVNRRNVADNLTAILSELTKMKSVPENGVAFFYGIQEGEGGGTNREIREILVPPAPIAQFVYICGREFAVEELEAMTRPKSLIVIVLIEGGKVTIGYLRGKHMELVRDEDYYIIGKTRAGGQSARRYEHIRDGLMLDFFKHVGRMLGELLLPNIQNVDAIVLGGNTIRAQEFLEKGDLDYRLKLKVAETIIPVSQVDEIGLYEAMKEASRILKETEIYAERQAWDAFLESLMKGSSAVTYGRKEVMEALKAGRVQNLMITEDSPDLSDELLQEVSNYGTELMVFSSQTESGSQLKGFGGIAAILRW